MEDRRLLATITWDGGGDGVSWQSAANWSGDQVPTDQDDVELTDTSLAVVSSGEAVARSLISAAALEIASGSLKVLAASSISGRFEIAPGASLTADGASASFLASGETTIYGASLYATAGGEISLPNVSDYWHYSTANSQARTLRASGAGSLLDLGGVLAVFNGTHYGSRLKIEALSGGRVDLSQAAQIADPDGGDANWRAVDVLADGTGSRIEFDALVSFRDRYGTTTSGGGLYSSLTAVSGGAADAPQLARLEGVNLPLDGTGTVPVGQITHFTQGRLAVSGANHVFDSLIDISDSDVQVTGVVVQMSNVTRINGADLRVLGGGSLALPSATSYAHASTGDSQTRTLRAEGGGSVLDLSHVVAVTNGTHYYSRLKIEAASGGRVDLSQATQIVDPDSGDARGRAVDVLATGTDSRTEFDALVSITDVYGSSTSGDGLYSTLTAGGGATVDAPQLARLAGVNLTLDGTGAMPVGQITHFTLGRLALSGTNFVFTSLVDLSDSEVQVSGVIPQMPNVTRINGADLRVLGGGTLALPSAKSYAHASTGDNQTRTLRAEGAGSVLDLSHVVVVTNGTHYSSRLKIEAASGGRVDLSQTTQIVDPDSGDARVRAVDVLATGTDSRIEFDALASITDVYGWSTSGDGLYSTLTASSGGTVDAPQLARLQGVNLTWDGTGAMPVGQITHFTQGRLALSGANAVFTSLVDISDSELQVTGVTPQLPNVTRISGTDLRVLGGGTLSLPSATSYAHASTGDVQTRTLRAEGTGSVLDLSQVVVVTNGTHYSSRLKLEAAGGGRVDLSRATQIVDPDFGDARVRAVDVLATGADSRIEFDALVSITDVYGWSTSSDGLYSTLTASTGGTVDAPQLARLQGVNLTLDGTGTIPVGQITHFTRGRLALSGSNSVFTSLMDLSDSEVQVTGVTPQMPSVTRINGSDLRVLGGGTLALPSATDYAHASTGNDQTRTLRAEGAGSVLDLSHVLTVTNGANYDSRLKIEAAGGGRVDLSRATQIVDPDSGDARVRAVDVLATGADSRIEFDALVSITDVYGWSTSSDGLYSTLTASAGGTVDAPQLTRLAGVNLTLDGTGTIPVGQITHFTRGRLALSGSNSVFTSLADLSDSEVQVTSVTPQMPNVTRINGADLRVLGGGTLALPSATNYAHASTGNDQTRTLRAEGAGSVLDLSHVLTVTNGANYDSRLKIEAAGGGRVDLRGATQIVDPDSGDARVRAVDVLADGTGSVLDLTQLERFIDRQGTSSSGDNLYSTLKETNQGDVQVPNLVITRGVFVSLGGTKGPLAPAESGDGGVTVPDGKPGTSPDTPQPTGGDPSGTWGGNGAKGGQKGPKGVVTWIGTSGDWSTASNWSTGAVPGADDDVLINVPDVVAVITISSGSHSVDSVLCEESLRITGGSLTVTGASTVNGPLTMSPGTSLTADGTLASFSATSTAGADGANLLAIRGGEIHLPNLTSYAHAATNDYQTRTLRAEGLGSVLDLGHVLTLTNGTRPGSRLRIEAVNGGQLNLSQATQITELSTGYLSSCAVDVKAEGSGSRIELDALASFTDQYGTATSGGGLYSSLTVSDGGTVDAPQLTALQGVNLVLDGTGTIPVGQITQFISGRLALSGSDDVFAALVDLRDTEVQVAGVAPQLPLVTQIDGADLVVSDGGTLSLPSATSYVHVPTNDYQTRTLRAEGAGSVLDLGHLLTLTNGTRPGSRLRIEAVNGGQLNLSQTTQITELSTGYLSSCAVDVKAEGSGSRIELDALASFTDQYGTATSGGGLYSSLTVSNGGTVDAPQLTALQGVNLVLDGTGTLPIVQITQLTQGRLAVSGGSYVFTGLVTIDGTNFLAADGGTLSLPAATSYAHASTGDSLTRTLRAEGLGSVLDLGHVLTLTNGTNYNSRLKIEAVGGGQLNLGQATQITELNSGNLGYRAVDVKAEGPGSRIDFDALASFTDLAGSTTSGWGLYSSLTVRNGGTVDAPQLTTLQGVNLTLDGTGTMPVGQITHLTQGRLAVSGGNYVFAALVDLRDSEVQVTGVAPQLPLVTQIDGADLVVTDGGTLALPAATSYAHASTEDYQTRTLLAEGPASVLDLGHVLTLANGTHYGSRLKIEAADGGQLNLGQATQITELNSGNLGYRAVDVKAEGPGSRIDFDALASFTDLAGSTTSGWALYSSLTVRNGGTVGAPQLTALQGVNLVLDGTGTMPVGQIVHLTQGRLAVSGGNYVFAALVDLRDSEVQVTGVAPQLPLVTQIDGADVLVTDGGSLALPSATSYAHASTGDSLTRTLRAEGPGSVLDLSHVLTVTNGTHYGSRLRIEAVSGGQLNLGQATQITELNSGNLGWRAVDVKAEGVGSRIEFDALASFTDLAGTTTSGWELYSSLTVSNGATADAPQLTTLQGVNLVLDGTGTMPVGQLVHLTQGRLAVGGSNHVFAALLDLRDSDVEVTGVAPQLPVVTQIDGADLLVTDGGVLSLPSATSYAHASTGDSLTRTLRAEGPGSVLDLSHMLTVTNGTHYGSRLRIEAVSGGQLNLGQATQITELNSGNLGWRAVDVKAEGVGSRIEFDALASFTDLYGTTTSGGALYSSLEPSDLAVIDLRPAGTSLTGVRANLAEWGTVYGNLELLGTSLLTGVGTIVGDVLNAGTVSPGGSPGRLTIDGDYVQTAAGKLTIEIGGLTPVTQYDQLTVTGAVTLDGALDVVRLNNYLPVVGDEFTVVLGATRSGAFSAISGLAWGSSIKLSPIYNAADFRLRAGTDAGPRIVGVTPQGTIDSSLRSFQLSFDEALNLSSFKAADITLTGPHGSVTVSDPTLVSGTVYAFTVDTQVAPGTYNLTIGPNVNDAAGNAMDQNGNTINGEAGDVFTHSVTVSEVEQAVLFVNVHGSYNADAANFYQDLLAAGARAKWLDLDVAGEVAPALTADVYDQVWVFDLSSGTDNYANDWQAIANWYSADPTVAIVCDARILLSLWYGRWQNEGLRLTENYYENIKTSGGGLMLGTDHSSYHSGINSINAAIGIDPFSGQVNSSTIPVDPDHPLMNTPNVLGPQLYADSSVGLVPYGLQPGGRVLYVAAAYNYVATTPGITSTIPGGVDVTPPFVLDVTPVGPRNADVDQLTVRFSEAMDPGTFQPADVLLTGPSGPIDSASFVVQPTGPNAFTVTIPVQSAEGTYELSLGPDIRDLANNPMAAAFPSSFTIDKTGPAVASLIPSGTVSRTVSYIDVVFDSAINVSTFTAGDVTLTGPGGPIGTSGPYSLGGNSYRLYFTAQRANGTYTVTLGPNVLDPAGNAMDQDGDGTPGEADEDAFSSEFTISLPDLTFDAGDPEAIAPPATAKFGETIAVSWKGKNVGTFEAAGPWQDGIYLSADQEWDAADTRLTLQTVAGPAAPGANYAASASVTLPLDESSQAGTYYLLVKSNADGAVAEADLTNNVVAEAIALELPALPDLTASDISAPATGNPGQSVSISWRETNAASTRPATGPWRTRVYLSADALVGDDVLVASFDYSGTLAPGSPVTRNELVTIPQLGVSGDLRFVVVVDTRNDVIESDETNNGAIDDQTISVPAQLQLSSNVSAVMENGVPLTGIVTRTGEASGPLVVTLASNSADLTVPASVTIPAGQFSKSFTITPVNNDVVDGTRTVRITATAAGNTDATLDIDVRDDERAPLTLEISVLQLAEGGSATATVTRGGPTGSALVVSLSSSAFSQLEVPATVEIPAGQPSATFSVTALQDDLLEADYTYTVTAAAPGCVDASDLVTVLDDDVPALTLTLESTVISEGSGSFATIATLTRTPATSRAVTVQLTSSDTGEAVVPDEMTFPADVAQVRFYVSAVEDAVVDGTQTVTLTATPRESNGGRPLPAAAVSQAIQVTDNDGPTLFVTLADSLLKEGHSTTVTVRRNTGTTGNLQVTLVSGDPSEALFGGQATIEVTIPDGADSATATVAAVNDGVSDGLQYVTLTATGSGHSPGSASLAVTDVDLPDLTVQILSTPVEGVTNALVNVRYEIRNDGLSAVDGHFVTRTYLSDDPLAGNDELVDEFPFEGVFPAGLGFERTLPVRMPDEVGQVWVIVTVDALWEVAEGVEQNNSAVSGPVEVLAAYSAVVHTDLENAASGTRVPMYGSATLRGGGAAAYALVAIEVQVNETRRRIAAVADVNGQFAVDFIPLPGEVGDFAIGATHPGDPNAPVQDAFTLFGFRTDPRELDVQLVEDAAKVETVTLDNPSSFPLTGIQAQLIGVPASLNVTVDFDAGHALPGHGTLPIELTMLANDVSVMEGEFTVRLTAAEGGAPVDLPVSFHVQPLRSLLVATPTEVIAAVVRGQQRVVEFDVTNAGAGATGEVQVLLPDLAWMNLASEATLASLASGDSATVTLRLSPAADVTLGAYTGQIGLVSQDGNLLVPFTFRVVSQAQGDLRVQAVDEFYFWDPAQPTLAGATVIVRDNETGIEVASGTTDAGGELLLSNLPEAVYQLEVRADKHDTFQASLLVQAGMTNFQQAFLSFQSVQYAWTVEHVEIEDRYIVSVEALFETTVPAPVLVVSPTVIDLSPLQDQGDFIQVDMRLENVGLIQIEDVRLVFPEDEVYDFRPLIDWIPILSAKSSVEIPIIIQRMQEGPTDNCWLQAAVLWSYDAGFHEVHKVTPIKFINADESCPVQPFPAICVHCGGGIWGGGGGGGGVSIPYYPQPMPDWVEVDVRIRIDQDVVTTRSAFEANLELVNNNLDIPLTEILVDVEIFTKDEDGNLVPADERFQVRAPSLEGVTAVDGTGQLAADAAGSATWVIVPTDEAAPLETTTYYVGGTLSFKEGGQLRTIEFEPVQIDVEPDAALYLKYFLQRDVYSDDPFTSAVEPAEPFVLGMILENRGAGTANDLQITSGQPQIIENDQGLLIDFDLIATQVDDQNLTPSFTASFGDVGPGQRRVAQWLMVTTLQGQFTEYEAYFEHLDALGDPRVSLIKSVTAYEMIHRVRATDPGADTVPDFLTNEELDPNFEDYPDRVHLSDGRVEVVSLMSGAAYDAPPVISDLQVALTVDPQQVDGFRYLRAADPADGLFRLVRVQRSDGSDLPLENFWQTDRTFGDPDALPIYEKLLHLFDYNSSGEYTLYYETGDVTPPAVAAIEQVLPDPRIAAVVSIDVVFSEEIEPTSFDTADVSLSRDGGVNLIDAGVSIVQQDSTTFRILGLESLTGADGTYVLTVDAGGVSDLVGHLGVGSATETWIKAEYVPYLVSVSGVAARQSTAADTIMVTFSEPINTATLGSEDLHLQRNDVPVTLTGPLTIVTVDVSTYEISGLAVDTATDGAYRLSVDASGVLDLDGNAGLGSADLQWEMDTAGPGVSGVTRLRDAGTTVVHTLVIGFSEPLDPGSLTLADLVLRRNGGSDLLDPAKVQLTPDSPAVYRLTGLKNVAGADGSYELVINLAGIADTLGNAGQGTSSVTWLVDDTPPAPATGIRIDPDTGISATDLRTNTATFDVLGSVAEEGLTVTLYDVTGNVSLGAATVTGTTFARSVTLQGAGSHTLRVRVTDASGNATDSFFDVFLDLVMPAVDRFEGVPTVPVVSVPYVDVVLTEPVDLATFDYRDLWLSLAGGPNLITDVVQITQGSQPKAGPVYQIGPLDSLMTEPGDYELRVDMTGVVDTAGNPGVGTETATLPILDPSPMAVISPVQPTPSGFVMDLTDPVTAGELNLYDGAGGTLGPSDVTLVGELTGPVRGSLMVSEDGRRINFVCTGGPLPPDEYTVTLRSAANGFRQPNGGLLDGDGDGTAGGDFTATYTIPAAPAGTLVLSVPDLARGAGQSVNVPASATGLPLRLHNAAGITSLAVEVVYDPGLLDISGIALAAGIPADWQVALNTGTPGVAWISASGTTAVSGTDVELLRLTAAVPSDAPYGASQAIWLRNISVNDGAIAAIGELATHKAVYLGDADGSGIHSSADAFLTVQAALGLAGGFAAHAWTDPLIVGDADGSGVLSAADAFLIVQEGLGLSEPFVPDNPHVSVTPVGGGVDPQFQIDVLLPAAAGGQISIPVKLEIEPAATNVGGFDFDLYFDPALLTIETPDGVSPGGDTTGSWVVAGNLVAAGHLRVVILNTSGVPLVPGVRQVAQLLFSVDAGAAIGVTPLDLEPSDPAAGGYTWTASDGSLWIGAALDWHNEANPLDVDGNGLIEALDALIMINYINAHPNEPALPAPGSIPHQYYDVNDDGDCTAWDVLKVINHLNAEPLLAAEGEPRQLALAPSAFGCSLEGPPQAASASQSQAARPLPISEMNPRAVRAGEAFRQDPRDRLFGDRGTDLLPLEAVLAALAVDVASVWR